MASGTFAVSATFALASMLGFCRPGDVDKFANIPMVCPVGFHAVLDPSGTRISYLPLLQNRGAGDTTVPFEVAYQVRGLAGTQLFRQATFKVPGSFAIPGTKAVASSGGGIIKELPTDLATLGDPITYSDLWLPNEAKKNTYEVSITADSKKAYGDVNRDCRSIQAVFRGDTLLGP